MVRTGGRRERERLPISNTEAATNVDGKYIRTCAFAGAFSCSLTHALMIPIDNLKTKMQVSEALSNMRSREAFFHLLKTDGWGALTKGYIKNGYPQLY